MKRNPTLLDWDNLPTWQRSNRYIRREYRIASNSATKCIQSLLYLHNESVNIYTHLMGTIFFSLLGVVFFSTINIQFTAASWLDLLAIGSFFLSVAICLGLSTTYHTLLNHSRKVNNLGSQLDLLGIVCLTWGSMVSIIYFGWHCERDIAIMYCTMITTLAAACACISVNPKIREPKWRKIRAVMFVSLGLSAMIPVVHGICLYGLETVNARMAFIPWLLVEGVMYIVGAIIYAARFPERLQPGKFDLWGSSHQIFHVLVLLGVAAHLTALISSCDSNHVSSRC